MVADFALCWVIEMGCKALFADLEPAEMVTRGRSRREKRRQLEERTQKDQLQLGEKAGGLGAKENGVATGRVIGSEEKKKTQ